MDENQREDDSTDIQEGDALGEGVYEGFDARVLSIDRLNGTATVYVHAFGPPDCQVVKLSTLQKY